MSERALDPGSAQRRIRALADGAAHLVSEGQRRRVAVAAVAVVTVGLLAAFVAALPRAPLLPDDALYLAVATAITQGAGAVMPSGDEFLARAPGYPAMLALAIAVFGGSVGPEVVRVAAVVTAAVSLFLLGRAWYGWAVAALAVALAFTSSGILALASSYRIDFPATALALLAIWLFDTAVRRGAVGRALGAGAVAGLTILTKETAIILLPAVVALWDVRRAPDGPGPRTLYAFGAAAAWVCAPWWLHHWAATGRFFPTDIRDPAATVLGLICLIGAALLTLGAMAPDGLAPASFGCRWRLPRWGSIRIVAGLLALVAWTALALIVLAPRPGDDPGGAGTSFLGGQVRPLIQPWWLSLAGLVYLSIRAIRERGVALVHFVAVVLYVPIAARALVSVWSARHLLLPALLTHLAAAVLLVDVARFAAEQLARRGSERRVSRQAIAALAVVLAVAIGAGAVITAARSVAAAVTVDERHGLDAGWDVRPVRNTARWIEANVPAGSVVLVSWLYGWELYRDTDGLYRMPTLPTVEVELTAAGAPFRPVSTLYRYTDDAFDPAAIGTDWVFLRKQLTEGYYVGLTQTALIDEIHRTGASFVVISGEHPVQSSTTLRRVLREMPGVTRRFDTGSDQPRLLVYEVDRSRLGPAPEPPLLVDGYTFEQLLGDIGAQRGLGPVDVVCLLGGPRLAIVPFDAADEAAAAHLERLLAVAPCGVAEPPP